MDRTRLFALLLSVAVANAAPSSQCQCDANTLEKAFARDDVAFYGRARSKRRDGENVIYTMELSFPLKGDLTLPSL